MKPTYLIPFLTLLSAAAPLSLPAAEPASSVMADGTWVRIRIDRDGIYQLGYDRLRELGFTDPAKVKVFGYQPNILLTHQPELMPADLSPLQSLNLPSESKLVFYGKSDTNFAPELWNGANNNVHDKHPYGIGATYFLSDADAAQHAIPTIKAPNEADVDPDEVWTTHTSLYFNEEDVDNLGTGGIVFCGRRLDAQRTADSQTFTVSKVATGNGRIVYRCLLSPSTSNASNYLLATYRDGITATESTGQPAAWCTDSHERFHPSIRYQDLQIPVEAGERTYGVDFSVHPNASAMLHGSALDYFGVLYERRNDLSGETQSRMFFENWNEDIVVSLDGMTDGWRLWNVSSPEGISEYELLKQGSNSLALVGASTLYYPAELVAFNVKARQPEPEIIGRVANQNLHGLATPELVVLAATPLLESAEYAADFHRRHQNIDVAVVDQQQVFNEYGSGNTSPEAIRRFLRHLDRKNPGILRALLIIGAASQNNQTAVADGAPYVVVPECEDEDYCANITRSYATDAFFGRLGEPETADLWSQRVAQLRVLGGEMTIGVGRLPYLSNVDVIQYYTKAEDYISNPPAYAGIGTAIVASDYSSLSQESHLSNAQAVAKALGPGADNEITVFRPASNIYSKDDNTQTRRILKYGLEKGAGFFCYFGHGSAQNIGGSTTKVDVLMHSTGLDQFNAPGRYPLVYLGTCSTAPYDRFTTNLSSELVKTPFGGGIGVIASGREVYQPMNQNLGEYVANEYVNAAPGDWIGDVWRRAQSNAIRVKSLAKRNVANHLAYNLIGDPAMPVYGRTHSVEIAAINGDGSLNSKADNEIKGTITDGAGNVDPNFNGHVVATIYDVPAVLTNLAGTSGDPNYYNEVTVDMFEIGEFVGEVKNGEFTLNFNGPASATDGQHRIRYYAYSSDGNSRALGVSNGVSIVDNKDSEQLPDAIGAPRIVDFIAGDGEVDTRNGRQITLTARIELPSGLAASSQLVKPVKLKIDDAVKAGAANLLTPAGENAYDLRYVATNLSGGRHTATLSVLDAAGQWAESTVVFMVESSVAASLSAAVNAGSGEVDLELASSIAELADKRLIIEHFDGSLEREVKNASFPCSVKLAPGVYRVYVQLQSPTSVTSTAKIEVVLD